MNNPLYQMFGQNQTNGNVLQRFLQFRNTFNGDPRQMVQQLLNSGKVSQDQYNTAVQMANQLSRFIK